MNYLGSEGAVPVRPWAAVVAPGKTGLRYKVRACTIVRLPIKLVEGGAYSALLTIARLV